MKRLLLCKQTDSPVVAHIYEHMVMGALKQLMWQRRLLRHVDYSALGTHYLQTGFLSIEIDLYTDEAIALESQLRNLHISITDEAINLAIRQITAETKQDIISCDPAALRDHSQAVHRTAWRSIDTMTAPIIVAFPAEYPTLRTKRTTKPIARTTHILKKPLPDDITLVPLFHFLTTAIHDTAAEIANSQCGYYNFGGQFTYQPGHMLHTNTIAALQEIADNTAVRHIYHDVISELSNRETISRVKKRIKSFSYSHCAPAASYIDDYVQEVNVVISEKTWRTIATEANISQLLDGIALV